MDVFWLCDNDNQVKITLKANWTGICTPIMLTGQIIVLGPPSSNKTQAKRSTNEAWSPDSQIYIT